MKEKKMETKTVFAFLKTLIAILEQLILDLRQTCPVLRVGI